MKTPARDVLLGLGIVALIAVIAYTALLFVTEKNRAAKIAQVKKPATIDAYEQILAKLRAEKAAAVPVLRLTTEEGATFTGFPEDWEDIINGYDYLFSRVQARMSVLPAEMADILRRKLDERTETERSQLAEFFSANRDLIEEIRRMAERGAPVYPLDFPGGLEMELPHLAQMRRCARLLREDAIVKAAAGNKSEAVSDIIAGMKLADALVPEPILISQIVRLTIYGIMHDAVQDAFGACDLPADLAGQLLRHIARADNRHGLADSYAGERHLGLMLFSDIRAGRGPTHAEASPGEKVFFALCASPLRRPMLNQDEATYADIMNQIVSAARLPYYEAAPQLDRIERDIENLPPIRAVSKVRLRALSRACRAQARHEARLDLMQMGLLLEQYKAQKGALPATLDVIAADLGGSLPVDPFSGEGYHYQLLDGSFLLYSVGENLQDDGGVHDVKKGDIVWRGKEE